MKGARMNPKDAAIDLIKHYVLRSDSLESLRKSYMGSYNGRYNAAIHGNVWKDDELIYQGKSNEIVVSKLGGEECCFVFKLDKLYNEIKSGLMELV